jgi:hypothetical protein
LLLNDIPLFDLQVFRLLTVCKEETANV